MIANKYLYLVNKMLELRANIIITITRLRILYKHNLGHNKININKLIYLDMYLLKCIHKQKFCFILENHLS